MKLPVFHRPQSVDLVAMTSIPLSGQHGHGSCPDQCRGTSQLTKVTVENRLKPASTQMQVRNGDVYRRHASDPVRYELLEVVQDIFGDGRYAQVAIYAPVLRTPFGQRSKQALPLDTVFRIPERAVLQPGTCMRSGAGTG